MNGKFIAFTSNTSLTYGPESYDKVMEWARQKLTQNSKVEKVYVGEFNCTVHRPAEIIVTPAPVPTLPEVPKLCVNGHGDVLYHDNHHPV